MAKIGTAHIEIKPVLDDDALDTLCQRIERAVSEAVRNGLAGRPAETTARPAIFNGLCTCAIQTGSHPLHSGTHVRS